METVSSYCKCFLPAQRYGKKLKSSVLVGIEVEVENVILIKRISSWETKIDGSLRNGKEYVIPVWHTSALFYLNQLFNSFQCTTGTRCSIHIHVDITQFTKENLQTLFLLYSVFEKTLYRYSGKRWDNIYCVPLQTWFIEKQIESFNFDDFIFAIPKYSGIHSLPEKGSLGTVEFRHMVGNTNPYFINNWINILVTLVSFAKTISLEELKTILFNAELNFWSFSESVFNKQFPLLIYSDFESDIRDGILFAKLITKD